MKIAIIGAAGVRTPLIAEAITRRQERLGLTELALMDIDPDHLELIGALISASGHEHNVQYKVIQTTDFRKALSSADFVITTFRVGGMDARVIDERVPLKYGILGQETTGPGGFAMGMRSIPVIVNLVAVMQEVCPSAWLINFANPSGMLTEAVIKTTGWKRVVGICDAPSSMQRYAAALLHANPDEVYLDYFGLNHLGWVRKVLYHDRDWLPDFIGMMLQHGGFPGLPFSPEFVDQLGMIPNEYLYFYYNRQDAVKHILANGTTRGEQVRSINRQMFEGLRRYHEDNDLAGMESTYWRCMNERERSYFKTETAGDAVTTGDPKPGIEPAFQDEGYAGVALNLIEALSGIHPRIIVLNGPNLGSVEGFEDDDVVEIPMAVERDSIQPHPVGHIPGDCFSLMKRVKEYERLTIAAATEGSYSKALNALAIHPLVANEGLARTILDEYRQKHAAYFPELR